MYYNMKKMILTIAAVAFAIGINAQVVKVSEAATWEWNDKAANDVVSNSVETVFNGLYIRGGADAHEIVAKRSTPKVTLKDGSQFKPKIGLYMAGNAFWSMIKPTTMPDNVNPKLDRCFALQTEKAGTLTVVMKPKEGVEDRYAKIVFNGKEVVSEELDSPDIQELTYTADKPGVFWFGASCYYYVYQVKFTPAE